MKKLSILFIVIALVLGLSQCKKKEVKPEVTDTGIFITLDASYNGAKTGFDPSTGNLVWSNTTEYINVGGSTSGYLGQLTGTGDGESYLINFSGTIATPTTGETLYFFYLGNGSHAETTTGAETGTLDFSNQAGTLADVTDYHIAVGSEVYSGQTSYSATLEMKAAFARIDMSAFSGETVYVHGDDIYATATIDYTAGTISGGIKGFVNVGTGSADKFVALIPSTNSQTTIKFDSNKKTGNMIFLNGIQAGKFYSKSDGSALQFINAPQTENFKGLFTGACQTVGSSTIITKMVRFSKGNLQYNPNADSWRFAEHQYDMCVNANDMQTYYMVLTVDDEYLFLTSEQFSQLDEDQILYSQEYEYLAYDISSMYTPDYDGWIDMFGWGTWGDGNIPYLTSSDYNDYQWEEFTVLLDNHNDWYTPDNELYYVFSRRKNYNSLSGCATINGVNGVIALPDDSELTINSNKSDWNNNVYTAEQWSSMESAGAVFMPLSGRFEIELLPIFNVVARVGVEGHYWTPRPDDDDDGIGYSFSLYGNQLSIGSADSWRYDKMYVRLVRDVN